MAQLIVRIPRMRPIRDCGAERGGMRLTGGLGSEISNLFARVGLEADVPELHGYSLSVSKMRSGYYRGKRDPGSYASAYRIGK